ncbi:hypothetical protein JW868_03615 [Candidatus Woesearchaeota archaeon]|nr:hypothetical protein [Candidatus Woesearchaeota archaeon]
MLDDVKDQEDLEKIRDTDSEWDFNTGTKLKKKKMDILNKKKISQWEMDELFCDF